SKNSTAASSSSRLRNNESFIVQSVSSASKSEMSNKRTTRIQDCDANNHQRDHDQKQPTQENEQFSCGRRLGPAIKFCCRDLIFKPARRASVQRAANILEDDFILALRAKCLWLIHNARRARAGYGSGLRKSGRSMALEYSTRPLSAVALRSKASLRRLSDGCQ